MTVAERNRNSCSRVDRETLMIRVKQGWLIPGLVSDTQFWLLVRASSMRSDKMVNALSDHLVSGLSRKDACLRHNVNSGHFSIGLNRLQELSHTAAKLAVFY